jgi:hypothetical protein
MIVIDIPVLQTTIPLPSLPTRRLGGERFFVVVDWTTDEYICIPFADERADSLSTAFPLSIGCIIDRLPTLYK